MAMAQPQLMRLTDRHREQAHSYNWSVFARDAGATGNSVSVRLWNNVKCWGAVQQRGLPHAPIPISHIAVSH